MSALDITILLCIVIAAISAAACHMRGRYCRIREQKNLDKSKAARRKALDRKVEVERAARRAL